MSLSKENHAENKNVYATEKEIEFLQRTGAPPETTLMVGDNPEMDIKLANPAGIKQVVLVRRGQAENWTYGSDGALYVKGLEEVLNFLS